MPDRTLFAEAIVLYANPFSYISLKKSRISFREGAGGCICLPAQNPPHLCRITLYWTVVFGLHEWQISYVACADMPKLCSMSLINALLKGPASCGAGGRSPVPGEV